MSDKTLDNFDASNFSFLSAKIIWNFFRLAIFLRTTKTGIFSLFRSGSFRNESLRALYRQNTNGTIQNGDLGLEGGILEG